MPFYAFKLNRDIHIIKSKPIAGFAIICCRTSALEEMAVLPYETQAMNRTKNVLMNGYPVKFTSCEDVTVHKMIQRQEPLMPRM